MDIREIQNKYGFSFKSSLGQNFLNNNHILEDVLNDLHICKEDIVLEIGPGFGILTKQLLDRCKKVISIEIDSRVVNILNNEFKDYDNFELINCDFLKANLKDIIGDEKNIKVIANIPYYITTPILEKLFKSNLDIDYIVFLLQEEVGNRILAKESTKEYGSLTVFSKYYSKTSLIRKVSSSNFIPKPKVDSVFIKFEVFNDRKFKDTSLEEEFLFFLKKSFSIRRKNLFNVFMQFNKTKIEIEGILNSLSIDFNKRVENLSLNDFQNIFALLNKLSLN